MKGKVLIKKGTLGVGGVSGDIYLGFTKVVDIIDNLGLMDKEIIIILEVQDD